MSIGRINRLELREVWRDEARDFTPWLQENIDLLSDCTGVPLLSPQKEQEAGRYSADLVCSDGEGGFVVVENQLGDSDHKHLGQIITYLAAVKARRAIWIVRNVRQEHLDALSWLNETRGADFYLVKVEAIKIGDSDAAPLFTLILGPSETVREIKATEHRLTETSKKDDESRQEFWHCFLDVAKGVGAFFSDLTAGTKPWIGKGAGTTGIKYQFWLKTDAMRINLRIDRTDGGVWNEKVFDYLFEHQQDIENKYGGRLIWNRLEENRACWIGAELPGGLRSPKDSWKDISREVVGAMVRLKEALEPFLPLAVRTANQDKGNTD